MERSLVCKSRLKTINLVDKKNNPDKIVGVLRSDIHNILLNYTECSIDDIDLSIKQDGTGGYELILIGKLKRIKQLHSL